MNKSLIKKLVKKKRDIVVFEIRAADGRSCAEYLQTFSDCEFKMFCFEEDRQNIQAFKFLIGSDPRVKLIEAAIGDVSQAPQQQSAFVEQNSRSSKAALDQIVQAHGVSHIDWLRIESIEDLEPFLKGGAMTLANKLTFLYTKHPGIENSQHPTHLTKILKAIPGFQVIADFGTDALLMNPSNYQF